jgi:hypothetical protein
MTRDEFAAWLDRHLDDEAAAPLPLYGGQERVDALCRFYRVLPRDAKLAFHDALDDLLERARVPDNTSDVSAAERMFLLVQLANVAKPPRASRILARLATVPHLFDVVYAGQRLHSAILNALCRYDVDQTTINLVWRLANPERGFDYLVMCLRLVSYSTDGRATYPLLNRIVPLLDTDLKARHLAREMTFVVRGAGTVGLLEYMLQEDFARKALMSDPHARFNTMLLDSVLPKHITNLQRLEADEPAAILLRLWIASSDVALSISDIRKIAGFAPTFVSRDVVISVLAVLASRNLPGDATSFIWAIDADGGYQRQATTHPVVITDGTNNIALDKKEDRHLIDVLKAAGNLRQPIYPTGEFIRSQINSPFGAMIGSGALPN